MAVPAHVEQAFEIAADDGIPELVEKMRTLESFYGDVDEYRGFAPFIHVYRKVTEDVQVLHADGVFNNPDTMEQLDLYFAERYFEPMKAYLLKGEKRTPWKTYINYCLRDDRYESLAMFLGINAHINGDLLHAVNHVGLTDAEDYNRVNSILENHLSDSLHYLLLKEHDRLAFYAELVKPVTRYELYQTVIRWRSDIWSYASTAGSSVEPVFEDAAEQIAADLIQIGHETHFMTLPIECAKLRRLTVERVADVDSEQVTPEKGVIQR